MLTHGKHTTKILSKWYKHFGIDHVFIDATPEFTKKSSKKIDQQQEFISLEELRNFIMETDVCGLKKFARHTVFSDGDPSSRIMLIGEAPGEQEDIQGKPFVGQSGQLLDSMLKSVGLSREDTYITNIVFWRPPGNRTPSPDEIVMCMPYVKEHIRLINPRILLLLGGVAAKAILNTSDGITKTRGNISKFQDINAVPTFHPAYLLRSPGQKALAFNDMIKMKKLLT
ncbi:MAG: uracil-DNA glycosylase [Holosporales bacterium]|jgi:DNA polymerase|nr:uracil-DNA glycosylase [Holosporales bacterium]